MTEAFHIKGGFPLRGHIKAAGAKNSITKLIVASLLSDKKCVLHNVPNIEDVRITINFCREIGTQVLWDTINKTLELKTKAITSTNVSPPKSAANRISILMLGALLGRASGPITIPIVGGCRIGKRPIDFHISALRALGATIEEETTINGSAYVACAHDHLQGAVITLPYPSVGATENAILASCRAKGKTVIKNAAIEPEIVDLILFLQKLGVAIHLDVNRTIFIRETTRFYEVEHTVMGDRIEVACFAMAAISTKGRIFIENANQACLVNFLNKLREVNGGFKIHETGIEFFYQGPLKGGVHIETDVHPGFLTDWQQPFVTLLTQAKGSSVIHETVYENRFGYINCLKEMGADIELFTQCLGEIVCRFAAHNHYHSLVVKGQTPLIGKIITVPDLRAGFAYIMAALLAPEKSEIYGIPFIDRGYEEIDKKLQSLGAHIERVKKSPKSEYLATENSQVCANIPSGC